VAEAALNGMDFHSLVWVCRTDPDRAATLQFLDPRVYAVHHRDGNIKNNGLGNLEVLTHEAHFRLHGETAAANFNQGLVRTWKVLRVEAVGTEEDTFDVQCAAPYHNFVANGVIVHNSGKTSWYERIARYIWEKERRRTRWLLGDGGGQTLGTMHF